MGSPAIYLQVLDLADLDHLDLVAASVVLRGRWSLMSDGLTCLIRSSRRMRPHATSVFAEFTQLAVTTGAINLGQGFPDTDGPAEVIEAAVAALRAGHNQYPPGAGVPGAAAPRSPRTSPVTTASTSIPRPRC